MSADKSGTSSFSRRAMLRNSAATAAGIGLTGLGTAQAASAATNNDAAPPARKGESMMGVPFEAHETVRLGIIGVGNRGSAMLEEFLKLPGLKVTALCDVDQAAANKAAKMVTDNGGPAPAQYTDGDSDFENLCARDDVDLVYVASPWEWHVPMSLAAMRGGKHVGSECPIAPSLEELWKLVDTSEQTRKHCIQLENCCYGQNEMRVLRMAHDQKFGTLLFGAGGYVHNLAEELFSDTYYAGEWRRAWHTKRNGDFYPTHGLGPVSSYMDINRGDRLTRLTTMGSPAASLADYRERHVPKNDESWQEDYTKSDVTMSLIQTERGRVIHLMHDVSSPHPYSRLNQLGGSKGVFEDYPARIYVEPDMSGHEWGKFDDYSSYDHWLWKEVDPGSGGGHGGMDYMMLYRLVQTMHQGLAPDIDVYDSATWSAPFALSTTSLANGNAPVEFPDFTRGEWKTPHPGVDSPHPNS